MIGPPEEDASPRLKPVNMTQKKILDLSSSPLVQDTVMKTDLQVKARNQLIAFIKKNDGSISYAQDERDVNTQEPNALQNESMRSIQQKDPEGIKATMTEVNQFVSIAQSPLFGYNQESLEKFEPQKKHSKFGSKIKTIVQYSLFAVLMSQVLLEYIPKFGKQKGQELSTLMHNVFNYDLSEYPLRRLMPVHWFLEINKDEVLDRMECLVNNNDTLCEHYDEMKCEFFNKKSQEYESCVLRAYKKYGYEQKNFCYKHYMNSGLYLSSEKSSIDFVESFYSCLQVAGIPKGKKYCNEKLGLDPSTNSTDYFDCYEDNDVNIGQYGEDLCRYLNPLNEGQSTQGEEESTDTSSTETVCVDDMSVEDMWDNTCSYYNQYSFNEPCGKYDDDDFKANEACCICGGGIQTTIEEPYIQCLLDKGLNKKAEKYKCDKMKEGVYDENTYRYMCWPNSQSCLDDNSVADDEGDTCKIWYNYYPSACGCCDTAENNITEACCICGGGTTVDPTNVAFAGNKCNCLGVVEGLSRDGYGDKCPGTPEEDWCFVDEGCPGSNKTDWLGEQWEHTSWVYCSYFEDQGELQDNDYYQDSRNYQCSQYKPEECGKYDTKKFKASQMCTICGGGIPEVSKYCDQTRAIIESQKQCYENINQVDNKEYCDVKLHSDPKWTGPEEYLDCYRQIGLNTSDSHLCDNFYPLDDEKIGGSVELLNCYEVFNNTLSHDDKLEKCLSIHKENLLNEQEFFSECLIKLGSRKTSDVCWLDPQYTSISLDQRQFLIDPWVDENGITDFEWCIGDWSEAKMTAYSCWQKFESQAYYNGEGNETELRECFEKYNMPLSPELDCKLKHAPNPNQSFQVKEDLNSSFPENCLSYNDGVCQQEWNDDECQKKFEDFEYEHAQGYLNAQPETQMAYEFGHVCKPFIPDYTELNQCIEEIDQEAFNQQLNEKLKELSQSNSNLNYLKFSNNSEYCDKVFAVNENQVEQTESRFLCYDMINMPVTPFQYCSEMQLSSNKDKYMFNYFYKYLCLMFKQVELDTWAITCLDASNLDDRNIKRRDDCLKAYEADLMPTESRDGPLFIYQQQTDTLENLDERLDKEKIPYEGNLTLNDIDDFLCLNKISATFQSSPYKETQGILTKKVNEHNFKMNCRVFEYRNTTRNNLVVHLFFNDSESFKNPYGQSFYYDDCLENTCKNYPNIYSNNEMTINRTDSNEQYFNLTFSEDLNLLQIFENRLYYYKKDFALEQLMGYDPTIILDGDMYKKFTGLSSTTKLLETYPQTISRDMIPDQNLMGEQTNLTENNRNITKRLLGIPYEYGPLTNISIEFTKIFETIKPNNFMSLANKEIARINTLKVYIQMNFEENVIVIYFFGVLDLFSELGGLNASVGTMIASMSVYFLITYFYGFSSMIKRQNRHKWNHQLVKQNQKVIKEIQEELKESEKDANANQRAVTNKEKEELKKLLEEDYLMTYEDTEERLDQITEKVKKYRPGAVKDVFQYNAQQNNSKWEEIEHKENTDKNAIYRKKSNMTLSEIVKEIQQRMHFYSIYQLSDSIQAHKIKMTKIKYHTRLQRDQIAELTNKIEKQQDNSDKIEKIGQLTDKIQEQQKQIQEQQKQIQEQQKQIEEQKEKIEEQKDEQEKQIEELNKKFEERMRKLEQKVTMIKNVKKMELEQQIEMIEKHADNLDDQ